jgi:hypothetical protein
VAGLAAVHAVGIVLEERLVGLARDHAAPQVGLVVGRRASFPLSYEFHDFGVNAFALEEPPNLRQGEVLKRRVSRIGVP